MKRPRFSTIRARLTLTLLLCTLLLLPPVVAAVLHLRALSAVTRNLARDEKRCPSDSDPAPSTKQRTQAASVQASVGEAVDRAYRDVISLTVLCLFVLLVLCGVLPRRLVRPLRRLRGLLRQAEDGKLDIAPARETDDEIGDLARTINHVFRELSRLDGLKRRKITLLVDQRQTLARAFPMPLVLLDTEGLVLDMSDLFNRLFGRKRDEVCGKPLLSIMGWQDTGLQQVITPVSEQDSLEATVHLQDRFYLATARTLGREEPSLAVVLLTLKPLPRNSPSDPPPPSTEKSAPGAAPPDTTSL